MNHYSHLWLAPPLQVGGLEAAAAIPLTATELSVTLNNVLLLLELRAEKGGTLLNLALQADPGLLGEWRGGGRAEASGCPGACWKPPLPHCSSAALPLSLLPVPLRLQTG